MAEFVLWCSEHHSERSAAGAQSTTVMTLPVVLGAPLPRGQTSLVLGAPAGIWAHPGHNEHNAEW